MTISRIPSVEGGIQPTLLTAKGDLISATAASTVARLAVGSNDQILVADIISVYPILNMQKSKFLLLPRMLLTQTHFTTHQQITQE